MKPDDVISDYIIKRYFNQPIGEIAKLSSERVCTVYTDFIGTLHARRNFSAI